MAEDKEPNDNTSCRESFPPDYNCGACENSLCEGVYGIASKIHNRMSGKHKASYTCKHLCYFMHTLTGIIHTKIDNTAEFKSSGESRNPPKLIGKIFKPGCLVCDKEKEHDDPWIQQQIQRGHFYQEIFLFCSEECKSKHIAKYCEYCNATLPADQSSVSSSSTRENAPLEQKEQNVQCDKCKSTYCSKKCLEADCGFMHVRFCQLITECSYAVGLEDYEHKCANCSSYTPAELESCNECKMQFYCSTKCKNESWEKRHKNQCGEMVKIKAELERLSKKPGKKRRRITEKGDELAKKKQKSNKQKMEDLRERMAEILDDSL